MRILVTNDDGFLSPGLFLLCEALKRLNGVELDVVVPEKPQSAGGLAVTLHKPIRVRRIRVGDVDMYVISGKPCDAVIYALTCLSSKYDLVVSGVNAGENTSLQAILASGTLSPCVYAALTCEIPAVAFSADVTSFESLDVNTRCVMINLIAATAKFILERGKFPRPLDVVSVNFPSRITDRTRVVLCDVCERKFIHDVTRRIDPRGNEYFWVHGHLVVNPDLKLDTPNIYVEKNIVVSGLTVRYISVLRDVDVEGVMRAREYLRELARYLDECLRRAMSE